jgi:hypothetical protein
MQQTKAEQKMFELLQKILLFKKFLTKTVWASKLFSLKIFWATFDIRQPFDKNVSGVKGR